MWIDCGIVERILTKRGYSRFWPLEKGRVITPAVYVSLKYLKGPVFLYIWIVSVEGLFVYKSGLSVSRSQEICQELYVCVRGLGAVGQRRGVWCVASGG